MTKTALITGASSGIGYALALALAARNIRVIASGRKQSALNNLKSQYPTQIDICPADVSTSKGRETIIAYVRQYQQLDFLIHNAAVIKPLSALQSVSETNIRYLLEVNLIAPMLLTNALISLLHGGRILAVSSIAAHKPASGLALYCISKTALNMWVETQKLELANHKIAITSVIPGEVDTPMQAKLRTASLEEFPLAREFQQADEQHRLLSPQLCAKFLSWLLLGTSTVDFTSKIWNIYDTSHHPHWLIGELPDPLRAYEA